jgi:DNA-directed RNA polymerase subunit RPC12/RpoP
MATITFRCTSCQQEFTVGSDKAGKKAKCAKCGSSVTIPQDDGAEEGLAAMAVAAPKKTDDDDDAGGPMTYGLKEEDKKSEEEKRKRDAATAALKGPGRKIKKKKALITDGPLWRKTAFGMQLIAGGLCLWLGAYLLFKLPLAAGLIVGPEYAEPASERLVSNPNSPKETELDLPTYAYGVISSNSMAGVMLWFARIAQVLYLFMYVPLVAGYVVCLIVPDRYGTKMQVIALISLAAINAFFGLIFKLLPMLGLWEWTIMPLVAPEVAMVEMNQERMESLLNFWSPVPALDMIIAVLVLFLQYFEPVLIAVFIRACALAMKVKDLDKTAQSLMRMGLGQCFIQLAWLLCSLCGTSQVLLILLRVVYALGFGFFVGQMIWMIIVLFSMPAVVEEQLGDEAFEQEDEDEEDEEEEEEEATAKKERKEVPKEAADVEEEEEVVLEEVQEEEAKGKKAKQQVIEVVEEEEMVEAIDDEVEMVEEVEDDEAEKKRKKRKS